MDLMPYQREGADFLTSRKRALLADGMGLGKTAQAITAANQVGAEHVVVICPAIAIVNWHREWAKWGGKGHLSVYSYDRVAVRENVRQEIKEIKPDLMILDEAHYLKGRTSKRTKSIYGPNCLGDGVASHATRVWLLTGTPCPNNAAELFPHLRALWPELIALGDKPMNYVQFIEVFCSLQATPFGPKILGNKNAPILRRKLVQFTLRRQAEQVLKDLPRMFWQDVVVEPKDVMGGLNSLEAEPAVEALRSQLKNDGDLSGFEVEMATLRRVTGTAKAKAAAELVARELDDCAYSKICIFAHHTDVIETLKHELARFKPLVVTGKTRPFMRQEAIDQFQSQEDTKIFIGQIQACATAITLHASNQVLFVEASWTPSDNAQAAKRCHRIGQQRPVFVRVLGLANSIDEAVAKVLARKSKAITELLEELQ